MGMIKEITLDWESMQTGTLTLQAQLLYGDGGWVDVATMPLEFTDPPDQESTEEEQG